MLVVDDGARDEAHLEAGLAQLVGQVRVLVVHEQVGAHSPDTPPCLGGDRAGASAQAEDLGGGQRGVGGVEPRAVVSVAGGVDLVAGGVDEDAPRGLLLPHARVLRGKEAHRSGACNVEGLCLTAHRNHHQSITGSHFFVAHSLSFISKDPRM